MFYTGCSLEYINIGIYDAMTWVVGAIKGGIASGIRGVLYCAALGGDASVVVPSGPFGWALAWSTGQCVGAATTIVGAAMGAG